MELIKVGVELEFSDINTYLAINKIKELFGYSVDFCSDYPSHVSKPILDYSKWNCVIDNTIKNSDGSKCSISYVSDISLVPIPHSSGFVKKSKGVEVVSPATNNLKLLISDTEKVIELILKNGGKISRNLDNALHVHVDARSLDFLTIKKMPLKILKIQDRLKALTTIDGIPVPTYTSKEAKIFYKSESLEDFYKKYCVGVDGKQRSINHYINRRIINLSPWLKQDLNKKTIEFRCFSMSTNIKYIEEAILLSLDIYRYLTDDNQDIEGIFSKINRLEEIYEDSNTASKSDII